MGVFDYWHPVLLSRELGERPSPVRLHGRELVVFRTDDEVGVLADCCPHRGMRLSEGKVQGDELVCPYHGWSFRPDGAGRCPASPDLPVRAPSFDCVERDGAIWVKARGAAAEFPRPDFDGFLEVCVLRHRIRAPFEVVLDNFIEVEHTGTTHAFLGYDESRMAEVTVDVALTEDSVRVVNRGPQRKLPRALSAAFRVRPGDTFIDDWTTWFSPIHSLYDHHWTDPTTGEARGEHLRTAVFFTPVDEGTTDLFSFIRTTMPPWARFGLQALAGLFVRGLGELEVRLDRRMLERLADLSPDLRGDRLGRFDQPLVEARKRIDAIYRGGRRPG